MSRSGAVTDPGAYHVLALLCVSTSSLANRAPVREMESSHDPMGKVDLATPECHPN